MEKRNQKTSELVIECRDVKKNFGKVEALTGLDLEVKTGEVHGFLGPNGSGKSTTIRILLGLLRKTSGKVELFGRDPWHEAVDLHRNLAYVPGDVSFWPNLTGGEIIDLIARLRGGLDPSRKKHLLEVFNLDSRKKFGTYSKGNRQKVALVAALASDVNLYILDEPTSGLDPLMETTFQSEIQALKEKNRTILLSSHILAEVEALCDRITIIRSGKTIESGSLESIRSKHHTIMRVTSKQPIPTLRSIDGVTNLKRSGNQTSFEIQTASTNKVIAELAKHDIASFVSEPPSLEHLFMSHYEERS